MFDTVYRYINSGCMAVKLPVPRAGCSLKTHGKSPPAAQSVHRYRQTVESSISSKQCISTCHAEQKCAKNTINQLVVFSTEAETGCLPP